MAGGTAGRLPEARTAFLEALDADPKRIRLTAACAGVEQRLGLQEEAHGRLTAALEDLADCNSADGVAVMVALAADAFFRIEYQVMRDWGEAAVAGAAGLDNRPLTAAAEAVLAMACALTGAVTDSEAHRATAARLIDDMTDEEIGLQLDALGYLGGAELYLEQFEATAPHARRGIALAEGEIPPTLLPALGTATWVVGRLAESADVLDGAVEGARLSGNAQTLAWGLLNRSISALMAGEVDTALASGQEAVDVAHALDDGFLSAHARITLAAAMIESGDALRGVELLVDAGGGEEIPVVPGGWRAMFLEILVAALSGRELAVTRLVVDRRTNAEIAADLFLSLKTVETHMRNIFPKLGVSSRVEVARIAERAL